MPAWCSWAEAWGKSNSFTGPGQVLEKAKTTPLASLTFRRASGVSSVHHITLQRVREHLPVEILSRTHTPSEIKKIAIIGPAARTENTLVTSSPWWWTRSKKTSGHYSNFRPSHVFHRTRTFYFCSLFHLKCIHSVTKCFFVLFFALVFFWEA